MHWHTVLRAHAKRRDWEGVKEALQENLLFSIGTPFEMIKRLFPEASLVRLRKLAKEGKIEYCQRTKCWYNVLPTTAENG